MILEIYLYIYIHAYRKGKMEQKTDGQKVQGRPSSEYWERERRTRARRTGWDSSTMDEKIKDCNSR